MKYFIRKTFVIGLIIFLLMQLYQPVRNTFSGQVLTTDITKVYDVPKDVQTILTTSCYDCHSNNTAYPWYSYIQPARMFLDGHITEGKEELNFSEFGSYSKRKQGSKLKAMTSQIKSGEMPLKSYTILHQDAKLSAENRAILIDWIEKVQDSLDNEY